MSIDRVYENCGQLQVPYPLDEEERLALLVSVFLKWPARLVLLEVLFHTYYLYF